MSRLTERNGVLAGAAMALVLAPLEARAQATLPTGGRVAAGSATIGAPIGSNLTVTQTSNRAVINWTSFSIGPGSSVVFQQPGSGAAVLNRVDGAATSTIAGQLSGSGQIFLVNPNGIAITSTGSVQVGGGFIASTLAISNADFMSGTLAFTGSGASAGIDNAGLIRTASGGFVGLVGATVSNEGTILAPIGKIGLGSGEQAAFNLTGDGFLQVAAPTGATTADGKALIDASGKIVAAGGLVQIEAATVASAIRDAVNLSGVVSSASARASDGAIILDAGPGGSVALSGMLDASGAQGGEVAVNGAVVSAAPSARILANGRAGQGGAVSVWSDQRTDFAGSIFATGSGLGAGGQAEVSSHGVLTYTGLADLRSGSGRFGTLTLDPYNVTISNGADANQSGFTATGNNSVISVATLQAALASANVVISTGSGGSQAGDITVAAPVTWSSGSGLTLDAYHSIAVNANLSITGGGQLTLITNDGGTGGTLSFGSGASASFASGQVGQALTINGSAYTLVYSVSQLDAIDGTSAIDGSGLSTYGPGLAGDYALANNLDASGTTYAYALVGADAPGAFSGHLEGLGHSVSNLTINSSDSGVGLVGSLGSGGQISNLSVVGGSIVATSGSADVGGLVGYSQGAISGSTASAAVTGPSGSGAAGGLVGYLDTGGSVTNASSGGDVSGYSAGGLVGYSAAAISGSQASGSVSGSVSGDSIGGLVGYNAGSATLTTSSASGDVTGDRVGGLVGYNIGAVSYSQASGSVTGNTASSDAGGLIGWADMVTAVGQPVTGSVANSSASGSVSGYYVGGLVGYAVSPLQSVSASGSVSGLTTGSSVGGLVGATSNAAEVTNSVATGAVTGGSGAGTSVGGLIGEVIGTNIDTSRASGAVSGGDSASVGGLVGFSNAGLLDTDQASGPVGAGNSAFAGGLVGRTATGGHVQTSVATGAVTAGGGSDAGGLIGYAASGSPNIWNDLAMGSVTSNSSTIGGLVGRATSGQIKYDLATGLVQGSSSTQGGLVGTNSISVLDSAWDTSTTGQSAAFGANTGSSSSLTGAATASLQNGALPTGFLAANWGVGAGLYPYQKAIYPSGVQAVAGFVYQSDGSTPALNAQVAIYGLGAQQNAGTASSGANGYYYATVAAGTFPSTAPKVGATLTLSGAGSVGGLGYIDVASFPIGALILNLVNNQSTETTATTLYSALQGGLNNAFGSPLFTTLATDVAGDPAVITATNASGFDLDQSLSLTGRLSLTTSAAGAPLSISAGQTIASSAVGNAVILASQGAFINSAGSAVLSTPDGRWLIFSNAPGADTFGALNSDQAAIWDTASGAAIGQSGNRYVFATPEPFTVTSTNVSKTYGADASGPLAAAYTLQGPTNYGVYTVDATSVLTGAPSLASAGAAPTAGVAGSPYAITLSQGSLAAPSYAQINLVNAGRLTINPAALTITASDQTKILGQTAQLGSTAFTTAGLVNTDSVSGVTLASLGAPASAPMSGSPYAIVASDAVGLNLGNYVISYVSGRLTLEPANTPPTAIVSIPALGPTPPTYAAPAPAALVRSSQAPPYDAGGSTTDEPNGKVDQASCTPQDIAWALKTVGQAALNLGGRCAPPGQAH